MSLQAAFKSVDDCLSTVKRADTLEKPCLGQPFQLGMLYDCRTDSLIPGVTLWGIEALKTAVSKTPLETSDFEVITEDTLKEKTFHLGVDSSLKLSLLSGMVHVGGAAKFLNDRKSSKNQARVTLKYKSTTTFEQLTMDQLGNFEYEDVFDKDIATHVVTGMVYGADAFFVFDREADSGENVKSIYGKLKVKVGGLPSLKKLPGEGEISIDIDNAGKDEEEKLHCKFYGDFILQNHPATFRDAAKVYQELPELLKGKSVPKRVWLYPLGKLDSRAQRMVSEISTRLIDEFHQLMESLHETTMRSNDLMKTDVCSSFHGLKDELENLNDLIDGYRTDLEKSLATLLPKVRGGGMDETKLAEILKSNSQSPFSRRSLSAWISEKENEVQILAGYLKHLKQQEKICLAFGPGEVDVFINDLEIETVLCFDFRISWTSNVYLEKMEAYLRGSVENLNTSLQPWYRNKPLMQEMRKQFLCFKEFVNANHTKQSDVIKFIVTNSDIDIAEETNDKFVFVLLYESAFATAFKIPDQPSSLQPSVLSCDSLLLKWEKPKYGAASVNYYTLFYRSRSDPSDQWFSQTATDAEEQCVLAGLVPGTTYCLKVRAETTPGCSQESKECVTTMPPDKPSKPQASNVTYNSLQLTWEKPKRGAELVQSYTITFHSPDGTPIQSSTVSKPQECADLFQLTPKTTYIFTVRAESAAGSSPESDPSDLIETPLPISQPGKPCATEITHNSIELTWDEPVHGADTVKGYTIFFRTVDEPDDNWNSYRLSSPIGRYSLTRLEQKTVYFFKVRAETAVGSSPESELTDPIETKLPPPLGKPTVSNRSYKHFKVNWLRPNYAGIEYYSILYQETDEQPHIWHSLVTDSLTEHISFYAAQNKQYVFQIAAVTSAGTSSYSELSDPFEAKTMPWGAKVYKGLDPIPESNPPTYLLPTHCVMKKHDILKVHVGPSAPNSKKSKSYGANNTCKCLEHNLGVPHKVLMVIGATGAGKTTLINGMANYIMGVHWEDDFRFKLIAEKTSQDQSRSQTMNITAYTFYKDNSSLKYTLTVIDTPGFGDTEGLDRDKYIVSQIKELFSIVGAEGIDQLHGIGFVTQAPLARLTPTQRYVFDSILSIFGKDVAGNIFLMITFADGMRPPVLDAVKAANVPSKAFFKFNNSALFAAKASQDDEFDSMFWKMGVKSFDEFFSRFSTAKAQSLQQTREVMHERDKLEIAVQGLQPQITAGLAKIDELRQERQMLRDREADILTNKDFTYQVKVTKQRKINLRRGKYTTNCLTCNYTCHDNCIYANDDDKYKCSAMSRNGDTRSAECGVCPGNCSWKVHVNNPYRFELYDGLETRTSQELKKRFESAMSNKEQVEDVIIEMKKELDKMNMAVLRKIDQVRTSIERLQEIALRPNHLTEVEYIDILIESEKLEAKPRYLDRIQALQGVRRQAEIVSELMKNPKRQQSPLFVEETVEEKSMWRSLFNKLNPFHKS